MGGRFISIRSKIFGIQMMAAVLVILVLSTLGFFYYSMLLHDKVNGLVKQNNEQAMENVEIILNNAVRLTEYPMLDSGMAKLLKQDYAQIPRRQRKYRKIQMTREISDAMYAGMLYENPYVRSVVWTADNMKTVNAVGISPIGSLDTYEEYSSQEWYQRIVDAGGLAVVLDLHQDGFLTDSGRYISVGRSMVTDARKNQSAGVVTLNIEVSVLRHILELTGFADSGLTALTDSSGEVICYTAGMELSREELSELVQLLQADKSKSFVFEGEKYEGSIEQSGQYGWKLVKMIPCDVMYEELIWFRQALSVILIAILLLLAAISYLFANSITRPILKLSGCLEEMKMGNWNVRAKGGNDETGLLAEAFNAMAGRIEDSVEAIYKTQEEKRKAELLALQTQINPHFLYNTLRSIRWMADVQGADNVTKAIDDLTQLFRLSTQIQGEYITIEEDLNIITVYSEILMIRYMDWFRVEYEVDESLLSCKTIKFLLQPLLENAIYHGFQDWKKEGLIKISVKEEDGDIIFEVYDNGCGMDLQTIERVLTLKKEDGKGLNRIGVNNVNLRIQKSFGEKYGLSFESELGSYTVARARIPKIQGNEA